MEGQALAPAPAPDDYKEAPSAELSRFPPRVAVSFTCT